MNNISLTLSVVQALPSLTWPAAHSQMLLETSFLSSSIKLYELFLTHIKKYLHEYINSMNYLIKASNTIYDRKQFIKNYKKYQQNRIDDTKLMREFLVLALTNSVLVNIGKPKITKLEEFTDIDKQLLENASNKLIAFKYLSTLLYYFTYQEVQYYERERAKFYIIVLLRNTLKSIGYELKPCVKSFVFSKGIQGQKQIYKILKK